MVYLLEMVIFHGKLLNNQMVYDIYIQSMHIYAMKEFHRTFHPHSKKKQQLFFPQFIPFSKEWPPTGQEYRENTIDTMWLDGLIASKAITPSLGVNEAPALEPSAVLCSAKMTGWWFTYLHAGYPAWETFT